MAQETNRPDDEPVAGEEDARKLSAAVRLFDVRRVIGGLFVVYGVLLTLLGLFDSAAEIDKAQGVRINLWMGLIMLAFGLLRLLWLRLSPPQAPEATADSGHDGPAEG
jgi:hypothetical protein